jgi:hypothetical protein
MSSTRLLQDLVIYSCSIISLFGLNVHSTLPRLCLGAFLLDIESTCPQVLKNQFNSLCLRSLDVRKDCVHVCRRTYAQAISYVRWDSIVGAKFLMTKSNMPKAEMLIKF